jgi:hypothetical protein
MIQSVEKKNKELEEKLDLSVNKLNIKLVASEAAFLLRKDH